MFGKVSRVSAFCTVFLVLAAPAYASAPEAFVRDLAANALASLGEKGVADEEHDRRFRGLLTRSFDLPKISRFVLGRYWRKATGEQRKSFVSLFEDFTVQAYAGRFREIGSARLSVVKSREVSANQVLVSSLIELPDRALIEVGWRIRAHGSELKIVDVVLEGVSMRISLRDEFTAVIRQSGGRVAGLLDALRRKTQAKR